MGQDRISLQSDDEPDNEPFITTADHIRARQDKSHMPEPRDTSQNTPKNAAKKDQSRDQDRSRQKRAQRSQNRRSRKHTRQSSQNASADSGQRSKILTDEEELEQQAIDKIITRLKEKGRSDEFIEEHMPEIRERAQQLLQ